MKKIALFSLFFLLFNLSGCQDKKIEKKETTIQTKQDKNDNINLPQLDKNLKNSNDKVDIITNYGVITVVLFPELAPKAVENFVKHADSSYYDDTIFHRVVKNFVIQGGDPDGTGQGGESIWNEKFSPEISNQLYHLDGALAMARTESDDIKAKTQGSQFYIVSNNHDQTNIIKEHKNLKENFPDLLTENDYPSLILDAYKSGGTPSLDNQYTVFGQVVEGMDIVRKISLVDTIDEAPKEKVIIESIKSVKNN